MRGWVKLLTVVALLAVPSAEARGMSVAKKSKHCKRDHLVCDDGSKVYRNKLLDCKFDLCPEDQDEEEEPNEPDDDLDDDEDYYFSEDDKEDDDVDEDDDVEISDAIVVFSSPLPSSTHVRHSEQALNGVANVTSHPNMTSPAKNATSPGVLESTASTPQGIPNSSINSTASNSSSANNTIVIPESIRPATSSTQKPRSTKQTKRSKPHAPATSTTPPATTATIVPTARPTHTTQELPVTTDPSKYTESHHPTAATVATTQPPLAKGWQVLPSAPAHVWSALSDAFAHYKNNDDVCTLFKVEPSYVEFWNGTYHVIAHADCRLHDVIALAGKFSLVFQTTSDGNSTAEPATRLELTACGWEDRWGVVVNWLIVDTQTGAGLCETPHEKAHFDAQPLKYVQAHSNSSESSMASLSQMAHGVVHNIVQDKSKVAGVAIAAGAVSALVVVAMGALVCRKQRQSAADSDDEDEDTVLEKVPLSSTTSPLPQPEEVEEGKFQ